MPQWLSGWGYFSLDWQPSELRRGACALLCAVCWPSSLPSLLAVFLQRSQEVVKLCQINSSEIEKKRRQQGEKKNLLFVSLLSRSRRWPAANPEELNDISNFHWSLYSPSARPRQLQPRTRPPPKHFYTWRDSFTKEAACTTSRMALAGRKMDRNSASLSVYYYKHLVDQQLNRTQRGSLIGRKNVTQHDDNCSYCPIIQLIN